MSIDQDIQSKRIRNEWQRVLVNILYTYPWLLEGIRNILNEYGITPQQYNVLRILKGSYPAPISTQDIRQRMLDKMSDVSRIVDRLLAKGWLNKTPNTTDRRFVDVLLNEKGLALMALLEHKNKDLDNLASALTLEEAAQLNILLDKIRTYKKPEKA
ncbi:MAG: MarR family transcriptional regulator [Sphingobacteriales bacterium]|nr:MarR family transcriptional regulator [Sphingobacteriales bacterium]